MDACFSFDIITFESDATVWNPSEETMEKCTGQKRLTRDCLVPEAQTKVFDLEAIGGTNINEALKNGLQTAIDGKKGETLPDDVQSIIVFLSDGQPTIGVTNESQIKANIKQANTVNVPIYSLGFGRDEPAFRAQYSSKQEQLSLLTPKLSNVPKRGNVNQLFELVVWTINF